MRLLTVTNIISHHQLPLSTCLASQLGSDHFRFAVSNPPMEERTKLGWNAEESEPWILRAGEREADREESNRWWDDADVVITGNRDISKIADRLRRGKLTFYMSERWWKPPLGIFRLLQPRFAWMVHQFRQLAKSSDFHYLPMGGYAAADMRRIASFHKSVWNWGYFTAVPDPLPPCHERNGTFRILWAGRMLDWKRVDTLVRAFALLIQKTADSRMTLIGRGPRCNPLKQLVAKLGIGEHVDFHDSMPTSQVRQTMRNADVYVLPSNAYEGWGAVVNEAMSEGCPVVASIATGSAKTMIRHGENGLLFEPGNYRQLSELLLQLHEDEPLRRRLANAGQQTIAEEWSPAVASKRLLAVIEALLMARSTPCYTSGPLMCI